MELEAKPRSPLLGFDLISDMGILAGSWRPGSGLIRTCVDDVGRLGIVKCIDDGASLQICPDCIQKRVRIIISVGAMPCVILGDNWFTTNSRPPMGEEYARRFAQQSLQRCTARGV